MKIVTFGEIMLRLSPPGFERLLQSPSLSATFGGAEANVAVSLAQWGCDSVYVTRVPAHAIGDAAVRVLLRQGSDEDALAWARHLGRYEREEVSRHLDTAPFGGLGDSGRASARSRPCRARRRKRGAARSRTTARCRAPSRSTPNASRR